MLIYAYPLIIYCLGGVGGFWLGHDNNLHNSPLKALEAVIYTPPRIQVGPVSSLTRHPLSSCRLPQ